MPVFIVTPHDVVVGTIVVLGALSIGWFKIDAVLRDRRARLRDEGKRL